MKLLILTQKVDKNDPILGFFHRWTEEFSKHVEHIHIIALEVGEYDLPENVSVHSLGKEKLKAKSYKLKPFAKLKYIWRFYKYIFKFRKEYDSVFIHMNQIYVILGGLFWRLWNKKISLWYTHKSTPLTLRLAEKITNTIFTASEESFRLNSEKVKIMGHGIDINKFTPDSKLKDENIFNILSVGRLSPSKKHELIINSLTTIRDKIGDFKLSIVGDTVLEAEKTYKEDLKKLVKEQKMADRIDFVGSVPPVEVIEYYQKAKVFVNVSETGSLDKVVLEAMACGCIPVVSNEAFKEILFDKGLFADGSLLSISEKIKKVYNMDERQRQFLANDLRKIVVERHGLENLVNNLIEDFHG